MWTLGSNKKQTCRVPIPDGIPSEELGILPTKTQLAAPVAFQFLKCFSIEIDELEAMSSTPATGAEVGAQFKVNPWKKGSTIVEEVTTLSPGLPDVILL